MSSEDEREHSQVDAPTSEQTPEQQIHWIAPEEGIFEGYANFLYLNWTLFDVRVRFGQVMADPRVQPAEGKWVVQETAAITMPWGEVKFLRDILIDAVARYEKTNGELVTPKMPGTE